MIIDAVLDWVFGVLGWLVGLVPDLGGADQELTKPEGWLAWWNGMWFFLPMGTLLACVTFIIGMQVLMNNMWVLNWIIKRVRGG